MTAALGNSKKSSSIFISYCICSTAATFIFLICSTAATTSTTTRRPQAGRTRGSATRRLGNPRGRTTRRMRCKQIHFLTFENLTNSSWRWCLSQTYKWQACGGSLRLNSQASGIKVFRKADTQKVDNWSVAHILDLIIDQNLNSRSGSGDKSGPSRGVNHGATSPSTGRVITPQVGKVGLAC